MEKQLQLRDRNHERETVTGWNMDAMIRRMYGAGATAINATIDEPCTVVAVGGRVLGSAIFHQTRTARITLENDFHGTECRLLAQDGWLNAGQVRKARRVLCGIAGCQCGDTAGCRGPQEVELEFHQDGSARVC